MIGKYSPNKNFMQQGAKAATPISHGIGDIDVPFNVAEPVFRYRFPAATTLKSPIIYAADIVSPCGAPVTLEVWKNGEYAGSIDLKVGKNPIEQNIPVQPMDLLELRVVVKSTHLECEKTRMKDFWIMWQY